MNQILSQDEVDALLKGMDSGDVETESEALEAEEEYESYDWSNQGRNLKGNLPLFVLANQRYAHRLKNSLSNALGKLVDIDAGSLEMIKFEEFQRSLPLPTSIHLFKIEPLRGLGMLVIETRLVFSLIEAFFGGNGDGSAKVEGRDFTPIEQKIIEKVVNIALADMEKAWKDVYPLKTIFVRSETNPQGVNVMPPDEFLISVKFEVELKKAAGNITLCIPYASIQPIREKLAGGYQKDESEQDKKWVSLLRQRIYESKVDFSVDLGKSNLPVKDFLNMKEGDILVLNKSFQEKLLARVQGIPKY
ncbi:MAG: flagellar motor switch protein FliM, partial [Thermoplasmata archaeon]